MEKMESIQVERLDEKKQKYILTAVVSELETSNISGDSALEKVEGHLDCYFCFYREIRRNWFGRFVCTRQSMTIAPRMGEFSINVKAVIDFPSPLNELRDQPNCFRYLNKAEEVI